MNMLNLQIDPVFKYLGPMLNEIEGRPVIYEIGMHVADTTPLFRLFSRMPPLYMGFEPDPRNVKVLQEAGYLPIPAAIGFGDPDVMTMYLSSGELPGRPGTNHTASSSIKKPTAHLNAHPWCKFEETAEVSVMSLDRVWSMRPTPIVDLIWADVQGAQVDVIRGGPDTLKRTRYLYIELHPTPMYDGEPTFEELCQLLPDFEVFKKFPSDVLFKNKNPGI